MKRIVIATALVVGVNVASADRASGYALNAHVAICQHVLERFTTTKGGNVFNTIGVPDLTPATATAEANPRDPRAGVKAGRPQKGTFSPFQVNPDLLRIVSQNPSYFRAGCGAPDAFPFFANTDPSHSYGWDPVGISDTLWANAQSDQEKAWVLGWKAHLMMDGSVHAFANTYAAMSMKRNVAAHRHLNRPQVWDTFTVSNFMGHIAAESWLANFFVYAAKPENTKIDTPMEFAQRMFLSRGSPIRQHYSRILSTWKAGQAGDIKVAIAGQRPGVLGTLFHRALEHLHHFEEYHTKEYFRWEGHRRFYEGKNGPGDAFHRWFAGATANWQKKRLDKITNVLKAWALATTTLQQVLSARGGAEDFYKAIKPLEEAVSAYLSPDFITLDLFPPFFQKMVEAVKSFFKHITEAVKEVLTKVAKTLLEPVIAQVKRLAEIATGRLMGRYFDAEGRRHARALLAPAGLVRNSRHGEPDRQGAYKKESHAGIDGSNDANLNSQNRTRLLRYPFYRNAFMGVVAVLSNPAATTGLPSADFTNGIRCTNVFQSSRADIQRFTGILKGNDRFYNATVETCHTPEHTRMRETKFLDYDYQKMYGSLLTSSQGFSFAEEVAKTLRMLGAALGQIGSWAWGLVESLAKKLITAATNEVLARWNQVKTWWDGIVTKVGDGIKKVVDWIGYNACNAGCVATHVPYVSCWHGAPWKVRATCAERRQGCNKGCDEKFKK
jgi:hypothetical protein